jgi:hypothetical protein
MDGAGGAVNQGTAAEQLAVPFVCRRKANVFRAKQMMHGFPFFPVAVRPEAITAIAIF